MRIVSYRPNGESDCYEFIKEKLKDKYKPVDDYMECIRLVFGNDLTVFFNSEFYLTCYVTGDRILAKRYIEEIKSLIEESVPSFRFKEKEIQFV